MKRLVFKLFLILAAYAIALGAFYRLGTGGVVCGLVAGTALSGIVLLVRKESIRSALTVSVGCIVGGFFGLACLGDVLLRWLYLYDHGFGERAGCAVAGAVIGTVLGGLSFSLLFENRSKS